MFVSKDIRYDEFGKKKPFLRSSSPVDDYSLCREDEPKNKNLKTFKRKVIIMIKLIEMHSSIFTSGQSEE